MFHFPLLKSFQRIHLSPNRAVILCNILVFCHPAPNIEGHPFLAVCHCLLITFATTLHIWRLSPTSSAWWSAVSCCQGVIILDGLQKLHWHPIGNLETVLGFLMLHVRWSLMWNVTQHQLGEPSALDCDRFFCIACIFFFLVPCEVEGCRYVPELVTAYHVTWATSVDCCVMIILVECVLCLQFKKRQ